MLKDIEKFYNKTKLMKADRIQKKLLNKTPPLEYVHIFHKEYPRFKSIKLRGRPFLGEYEQLLKKRKSYRNFSTKSLSFLKLSQILKSIAITHSNPERRAYPSAGARYPIEAYLVAFNITEIEEGAYHFNSKGFSLEKILDADLKNSEREFVSPFINRPAGIIILTGVLSRSYVKYKNKAYPFALLEAGHMAQNIMLSCAKYKVGICAVGGFVNDTVSGVLDLTNEEVPLYVLAFGVKK